MKIALLGYGRMGRDVEQAAIERGHTIAARFDIENPLPKFSTLPPGLKDIQCAIDFSAPSATEHHIRSLGPLHVPLVVGTTGWNDQLSELLQFTRQCGGTILYASNFSVGANILFHAAAEASKLIDRFPEYDVAIHEIHHKLKKDAPSGTALKLADTVLHKVKRKTEVITALNNRQIQPHELLVSSSRVGDVAGTAFRHFRIARRFYSNHTHGAQPARIRTGSRVGRGMAPGADGRLYHGRFFVCKITHIIHRRVPYVITVFVQRSCHGARHADARGRRYRRRTSASYHLSISRFPTG